MRMGTAGLTRRISGRWDPSEEKGMEPGAGDAKWGSERQTLVKEQAQWQRKAVPWDVDMGKSDVSKAILL